MSNWEIMAEIRSYISRWRSLLFLKLPSISAIFLLMNSCNTVIFLATTIICSLSSLNIICHFTSFLFSLLVCFCFAVFFSSCNQIHLKTVQYLHREFVLNGTECFRSVCHPHTANHFSQWPVALEYFSNWGRNLWPSSNFSNYRAFQNGLDTCIK